MKSVVIGSTVHSNRNNSFSMESAKVTGISVVNDTGELMTWINLEGDGEERSITAEVFFKNYTDMPPFFKLGFTYKDLGNSSRFRFEVTELLKSEKPSSAKGLYALAKRHYSDGTYSYIVLDESNFKYMVQV